MRAALTALLLLTLTAAPVPAGPWLRDKGAGFASASGTISQNSDTSASTYLEYGLTEQTTLGLDLSFGLDRTGQTNGSGIAFLRFPLGSRDGPHLFAWHLGIGGRNSGTEIVPAAEVGLSWGRSVPWGDRWGWATVDTSINVAGSPAKTRTKIDGTFGMGLTPKVKVMLQMFNTFEDGRTFSELAPSLLLLPGKSGKTTLQIGIEQPVAGGGDTQLKLGIWRDF